jgi:hypothetical protein
MSYHAQDQLTFDLTFTGRVRSCSVQQADIFKADARPDFVALANDVLGGDGEKTNTFTRLAAAAPGLADKATTEDGVDQSLITDEDVLSTVQANWQVVAALYYATDGTPIAT